MIEFDVPALEDLRGNVKPTSLGHGAGESGMPPLDATTDPDERPIHEAIQRLVAAARSRLEDQLTQSRQRLDEINTDPSGDINAAVKKAESRFDDVADLRRSDLHHKRVELDKRRTDLKQFRRDNQIDRSPDYPESGWLVFMWGAVLMLFVIESFANANFLAVGAEQGILGAYTIAFGISVANLFPPFLFFGPFSRYFQHVQRSWRLSAGLVTAFYVVFVLTLNLGVAHYREVSGELIGDGGIEVVQRMADAPLALQDAESWLLFAIGMLFSAGAFFDGWKRDDAYPGYGKLDRIMKRARDEYLDERRNVAEELDDIREDALDKIRRVAAEARKQPQEHKRIVVNWRHLCDHFDRYVGNLEEIGATLIEEYRDANHRARPDRGVPVAHRNPWRLASTRDTVADKGVLDEFDSISESRLEDIEREYRQATDLIHAKHGDVRTTLIVTDETVAGGEASANRVTITDR